MEQRGHPKYLPANILDVPLSAPVAVSLFAVAAGTANAQLGDEAYRLPLVEPFAIRRVDLSLGTDGGHGTHQLVKVSDQSLSSASFSYSEIMPNVEQIAVAWNVIVGKAALGYFLLDARDTEP